MSFGAELDDWIIVKDEDVVIDDKKAAETVETKMTAVDSDSPTTYPPCTSVTPPAAESGPTTSITRTSVTPPSSLPEITLPTTELQPSQPERSHQSSLDRVPSTSGSLTSTGNDSVLIPTSEAGLERQVQLDLFEEGNNNDEHSQQYSLLPFDAISPSRTLQSLHSPTEVSSGFIDRLKPSLPSSLTSDEGKEDNRLRIGQSRILLPDRAKETLFVANEDGLSVHTIEPESILLSEELRLRKCRVTQASGVPKPEKVVLLIGATGAGKTSLMHSMANYVCGVNQTSTDRLRLKPHVSDVDVSSTCSQTRLITAYTFEHQPGFQIPFSLTIIDTPGMGDTEGIARDMDICKQLKEFLEMNPPLGLDHIDAICFVVKSTDNRRGAAMNYTINEILKLFSKDVRQIFHLFTTFHDGSRPCVLDAMAAAKVQFQQSFPINNTAFFTSFHSSSDNFQTTYADIQRSHFITACNSLKEFFGAVVNNSETPCSLTLTREVLRERERLQITVECLADQIQMRMEKLKESEQERKMLEEFQEEAAKNENFNYTVEQTHFELAPTKGRNVTNCTKCKQTCCEGCTIYFDKLKWFCAAIGKSGRCKVCPGKCGWSDHHNPGAKLVPRVEVVTRTYEDIKRKYDLAVEGRRGKEELLQRIRCHVDEMEAEVMQMIGTARQSLQRLNQIALRNHSQNAAEYVDMLMADERAQLNEGWQMRVEHLQRLKEKIQLRHLRTPGEAPLITPSFVDGCMNEVPLYMNELDEKP